MKSIIIYSIFLLFAIHTVAQQKEIFYADPTIYVENGRYYLTGTGGDNSGLSGFSVLTSEDLKNWVSPKEDSIHKILTQGKNSFGTRGFWAPQIFKVDNRYYLTYTSNEQTVLAKSNSVLGPYRQDKIAPIDASEKNIDSFIFKDEDGKYYLYHVRFDNGNYLWVAELDMATGNIKSSTLKKVFEQTETWEATSNFKSAPIMEGPTIIKLKNKYYLFYSANHFKNIDYAVGYAVADSPYGPWEKQKDSPIIHRSIVGENGSGHGDLFEGLNGQLYYVYHVHFSEHQVSPRRTRIVPVKKKWDSKEKVYSFSVNEDEVLIPVLSKD